MAWLASRSGAREVGPGCGAYRTRQPGLPRGPWLREPRGFEPAGALAPVGLSGAPIGSRQSRSRQRGARPRPRGGRARLALPLRAPQGRPRVALAHLWPSLVKSPKPQGGGGRAQLRSARPRRLAPLALRGRSWQADRTRLLSLALSFQPVDNRIEPPDLPANHAPVVGVA